MAMVAAEEMKNLPEYAPQCCVVYMPEVGYLLGITLWRENLTTEEMQIEGLEFRVRRCSFQSFSWKWFCNK